MQADSLPAEAGKKKNAGKKNFTTVYGIAKSQTWLSTHTHGMGEAICKSYIQYN